MKETPRFEEIERLNYSLPKDSRRGPGRTSFHHPATCQLGGPASTSGTTQFINPTFLTHEIARLEGKKESKEECSSGSGATTDVVSDGLSYVCNKILSATRLPSDIEDH
ncbi:hypothetical protein J6590_011422 [Homalodisca vitripennis]|nr:hypothetical protein J6590_011422 [Homalodisca vitripennis]